MCHYTHLTPFEREKILFFLAEGKSITEIAHLLKRSKETASQERQRRTSWQVRHIAPHRRASCQCSEPFRPWPLGSGYCGGQARKAWAFYGSSSRRAKTSRIRQRITSNGSTMS